MFVSRLSFLWPPIEKVIVAAFTFREVQRTSAVIARVADPLLLHCHH